MAEPSPSRAMHSFPVPAAAQLWPFRRTIIALECFVAIGGIVGVALLWTGRQTPPLEAIEVLGMASWRLPALWLFATVVLPSAVAAWFAWRKSPHALTAVLVAAAALAVELIAQIPFVGPDTLQAVFGAVALVLAACALIGRNGWGRHRLPQG